jgi:hypothetical protein
LRNGQLTKTTKEASAGMLHKDLYDHNVAHERDRASDGKSRTAS